LFTVLCSLFFVSCTAKRVELPDYKGVDIKKIITERSSIKGVNATFYVEFEKADSTISGDAALTLTEKTLDLRIYSMGFLMAEIKEADGIIKSTPPTDRNKNIILVEGLRNSILWWLIRDYEIEEQNGNYHVRNSSRKIVIDKKSMLPVSQTIEFDSGKELRISYEEPANSNGFWYPSRMKIELSKYTVKLKIKSISSIPRSAQGQQ
jgi:outer membrane lipoprotein-sorting protein